MSTTEHDPTVVPTEHREVERIHVDSVVLVNTGNGKGKSSAAFGVAVRALARGWSTVAIQFIKSGDWRSGEHKLLSELGVQWRTGGDGFTWLSEDLEESQALAHDAWDAAAATLASGDVDVLILDELTYPVNWGWLDVDEVVAAIRDRSPKTNVVITGRNCPEPLIELADTVTEMVKVKHAYDRGIKARRGIDF